MPTADPQRLERRREDKHWFELIAHFEARLETHAQEEILRYEALTKSIDQLNQRLSDFLKSSVPHSPPCQHILDIHAGFIQDPVAARPDFMGHRVEHETMDADRKEMRRNLKTVSISVISAAIIAASSWAWYAMKSAAVAEVQKSMTKEDQK